MNKQYKPNEFAKLLNVSVKTLQRWDRDGVLEAFRTGTIRIINILIILANLPRKKIREKLFCTVEFSGAGQKDDLQKSNRFFTTIC